MVNSLYNVQYVATWNITQTHPFTGLAIVMHLHFHLTLAAVSVLNHVPLPPLLLRDSLVHFIVWIKSHVNQLPLWG